MSYFKVRGALKDLVEKVDLGRVKSRERRDVDGFWTFRYAGMECLFCNLKADGNERQRPLTQRDQCADFRGCYARKDFDKLMARIEEILNSEESSKSWGRRFDELVHPKGSRSSTGSEPSSDHEQVPKNKSIFSLEQACSRDNNGVLLDPAAIVARDVEGYTPLLRACMFGKLDAFEQLLAAGSDIRAITNFGETALHLAVRSSNFELIKRLLELGFELSQTDKHGRTAIHEAAIYLNPDVLGLLINLIPLGVNKKDGHEEDSNESKLEISRLINLADLNGWTALHCAVSQFGRWEYRNHRRDCDLIVPRLLLCHGANVDAADNRGLRPIHLIAIHHRNSDILKLLLEFGADPDARDPFGRTPLMTAAMFGCDGWVDSLASVSIDFDLQDKNGNTAAHLACLCNEMTASLMAAMLLAGADIRIRNNRGQSICGLEREISVLKLGQPRRLARSNRTSGSSQSSTHLGRFEPLYWRMIELDVLGLMYWTNTPGHSRRDVMFFYRSAGLKYKGDVISKVRRCFIEKAELKRLQLQPAVSLYDWLTIYRLKWPLYTGDSKLVERLQAAIDSGDYPNYRDIMRGYLRIDKLKLAILEDAKAALDRVISLARPSIPVPPELCEMILVAFTNGELRNFIKQAACIYNRSHVP